MLSTASGPRIRLGVGSSAQAKPTVVMHLKIVNIVELRVRRNKCYVAHARGVLGCRHVPHQVRVIIGKLEDPQPAATDVDLVTLDVHGG